MNLFKILILIIGFFFAVDTVMAQSEEPMVNPGKKEQRKIEKAERKRLKEEERKRNRELVNSLVEDQTFVLEATTIFGRYNTPFQVQPDINFVKIAGDRLTIQTANNFSLGYNGLGGITINGTINDYKIRTSKKDGNSVSLNVQFISPIIGQSSINLEINANGISRALFVDNWGRRMTFQGQILSLENSRIFEGRPLI